MLPASERFDAWFRWSGQTLQQFAEALACHRTLVWHIAHGNRKPGRALSGRIERLSAAWPPGPIRVTEWDQPGEAATGTDDG